MKLFSLPAELPSTGFISPKTHLGISQNRGKTPQNGWFISWKSLWKWMIWGFSHIFGTTHFINLQVFSYFKVDLAGHFCPNAFDFCWLPVRSARRWGIETWKRSWEWCSNRRRPEPQWRDGRKGDFPGSLPRKRKEATRISMGWNMSDFFLVA